MQRDRGDWVDPQLEIESTRAQVQSRLPPIYRPARWRGTTPVCSLQQMLGVSFTMADGSVLYLRLPVDSARRLAQTVADYVGSGGTQSPSSSESPSLDGSPQAGSVHPDGRPPVPAKPVEVRDAA